jgi:hypothetical protein
LSDGLACQPFRKDGANKVPRGKKYTKDEAAAMDVRNCIDKKEIKELPFIKYFELGANNEGYWGYNHMVLQLEDCVDCLKVVYPHLDFVFLFQHSSGHSKKRRGGLDAGQMNTGFGGSQPMMQKSMIQHKDGYLGPYNSIYISWCGADYEFFSTNIGPFWMTATEQNERRLDQARSDAVAPKPRNKTKKDLAAELSMPGLVLDPSKFKLEKLQEMASAQNIPFQNIIPNIEASWVEKQKGLLQVLWEHGWIDVSHLDNYAIMKKDETGAVDKELSLHCLMESCLDFANETTEVRSMREKRGVRVILMTKFHAEMAGEEIEYLWGVAKSWYCSKPLHLKSKKGSFLDLIRGCLDLNLITKEKVRSFSKRARSYIFAYYAFEHTKQNDNQP